MAHRRLLIVGLFIAVVGALAGCERSEHAEGVRQLSIDGQRYVAFPVEVAEALEEDEAQAAANQIGRPAWYAPLGIRRDIDTWLVPMGLAAQVIALLALLVDTRSGRSSVREGRPSIAGWIGGGASIALLAYFIARLEPVGALAMLVVSLTFIGGVTSRRMRDARDEQAKGVGRRQDRVKPVHSTKTKSKDEPPLRGDEG